MLSTATWALVADRLPPPTSAIDLGEHRLRDLARPERIWQLVHPGLRATFPPLRSLEVFRHNLPVQLTPLVGRGREIAEVVRLLAAGRLVTLTGPGGVGKTRLAFAVGADLLDHRPGGVWCVELASVSEPDAIGAAILAALGGRPMSTVPMADQVAVALGTEPALLVVDNCEHLVGGCADLVAAVLVRCPNLAIVATSREPLGVPGEVTWSVPSLRCPRHDQVVSVPALSQFDRGLVHRAGASSATFVQG